MTEQNLQVHRIPENIDPEAMRRNAGKATNLLKSLANENRLMILCVLSEGEHTVSALNKRVDLSQSALSQHLAILREQGLVRTRREAQSIFYSLSRNDALMIIGCLHDIYCSAD